MTWISIAYYRKPRRIQSKDREIMFTLSVKGPDHNFLHKLLRAVHLTGPYMKIWMVISQSERTILMMDWPDIK